MTQAAIYCRISKDREAEGLGVERQRADCEALAARLGWAVAGTFTDDDRSAYSGKPRPAYRDMLAAIEVGTVGAVLAWHPDRLHRSPRELEDFIDLIERHAAAVQTVTAGAYDLTTPTCRMQARIVGNVARFESEHRSERLRRKMDQLVADGQPHVGGTRPFGYRRVTGPDGRPTKPVAFDVVPEEAALILEAADAILEDGRSLRRIVADWRARGVVSPYGKPWQPGALRKMLCSPRLAGLRERHVDRDPKVRDARKGEVAVSEVSMMAAILPRARWQALRAILTDPARRTTTGNARVNLLAGLAFCGLCGERLRGSLREDGAHRYVCPAKNLGGCGGISVLAAPLEAEVVGRVLAALDSPEMHAALAGVANATPDADPLGQRAEIEARLTELTGAYAAGEITRSEWQTARAVLAERLAALPAVTRPTPRLPADVAAAWPTLDLEGRRRILAIVIEKITVNPAKGPRRFDPERIVIKWRV